MTNEVRKIITWCELSLGTHWKTQEHEEDGNEENDTRMLQANFSTGENLIRLLLKLSRSVKTYEFKSNPNESDIEVTRQNAISFAKELEIPEISDINMEVFVNSNILLKLLSRIQQKFENIPLIQSTQTNESVTQVEIRNKVQNLEEKLNHMIELLKFTVNQVGKDVQICETLIKQQQNIQYICMIEETLNQLRQLYQPEVIPEQDPFEKLNELLLDLKHKSEEQNRLILQLSQHETQITIPNESEIQEIKKDFSEVISRIDMKTRELESTLRMKHEVQQKTQEFRSKLDNKRKDFQNKYEFLQQTLQSQEILMKDLSKSDNLLVIAQNIQKLIELKSILEKTSFDELNQLLIEIKQIIEEGNKFIKELSLQDEEELKSNCPEIEEFQRKIQQLIKDIERTTQELNNIIHDKKWQGGKHECPYGCRRPIPDAFKGCTELLAVYPKWFE